MVEPQISNLMTGVQFPSPALRCCTDCLEFRWPIVEFGLLARTRGRT